MLVLQVLKCGSSVSQVLSRPTTVLRMRSAARTHCSLHGPPPVVVHSGAGLQ